MKDEAPDTVQTSFADLGLGDGLLSTLTELGYEKPTLIQELAIPLLVEGRDIIGQAQTGTGKTAAFALPLLDKVDPKEKVPQILVLAPTRELALQVCDAMKGYSKGLKKLEILPVYGGQGMAEQLRALRRGVHVVVGTPGRLIDHLERGTLKLASIKALVLDEADEMLRMGFYEEVEKILESVPEERQTALFSATMPPRIRQIAKRFLNEPVEVKTKSKEATVESVSQYYVQVSGEKNKVEALSRILMAEDYDGVIVFVRTRAATAELVEKLDGHGFAAQALNGDMSQQLRQSTVERFKRGKVDILVCTDVAARGLDVPRISHVLNYDIPKDTEIYVHRIGRTGRAGREGKAILFAGRREQRMLQSIERATRKQIERMALPTGAQMGQRRIDEFKALLGAVGREQELTLYLKVVEEYCSETDSDPMNVAAALAYLHQRARPFVIPEMQIEERQSRDRDSEKRGRDSRGERDFGGGRSRREERGRSREDRNDRNDRGDRGDRNDPGRFRQQEREPRPGKKMGPTTFYKVAVGQAQGLEPGHLVGAIVNEAGLERGHVGAIRIAKDYAVVELPAGMPEETLAHMKTVWACGAQLNMELADDSESQGGGNSRGGDRSGARPAGRSAGKRLSGERGSSQAPARGSKRVSRRTSSPPRGGRRD